MLVAKTTENPRELWGDWCATDTLRPVNAFVTTRCGDCLKLAPAKIREQCPTRINNTQIPTHKLIATSHHMVKKVLDRSLQHTHFSSPTNIKHTQHTQHTQSPNQTHTNQMSSCNLDQKETGRSTQYFLTRFFILHPRKIHNFVFMA